MKKFIIPCLLLLQATSYAQFKVVAESPSFEEPEGGFAQILQMKNGNTLFVRSGAKDGYDLQVYDTKHQLKVQQTIVPNLEKRKSQGIERVFETNGDITVLMNELDGKVPLLYRLVVDGTTCKVKKDEKIAELDKVTRGQQYAMVFGHVPEPEFFVRKDLYSDNYAIAIFNSFESDRNKRIEVVLYGADHTELSRAYYTSPEEKYKYLEFIDMAVLGNEKVCILAYAYNTRASGGKESELVLATLEKGASAVELTELKFSKGMKIAHGLTRFNPVTKKLLLLAALDPENDAAHNAILVTVDPATRKIEKTTPVFPKEANKKNIELFGSKSTLKGTPNSLLVNNDGSFTIVYEEIEEAGGTTSSGAYMHTGTELGNVSVSTFDTNGKPLTSYLMPKNHFIFNQAKYAFYPAYQPGASLYSGNQFKSYAFLSRKDKMYVLFNDVEENTERVLKGKLTTIRGVGECEAYAYTLSGDNVLPARDFVFGKPENKRDHNLAVFSISTYDAAQDLFITLKLEVKGKDKRMKLVWMSPA
ncbi:MAG TPA: hypothetical protein VGE90_06725 [Chitinophaga sp.]